jgi:hypothetical protein
MEPPWLLAGRQRARAGAGRSTPRQIPMIRPIQVTWTAAALLSALPTAAGQTASPETPRAFVANHGQWPAAVHFLSRAGMATAWFETGGWTLTLEQPRTGGAATTEAFDRFEGKVEFVSESEVVDGIAVRMTFGGTVGAAVVIGEARLPGVHHYLLGDDETRWVTDVPHFDRLRYAKVWPGIDVITREGAGLFEYDLELAPGADLQQVVIHCAGVDDVRYGADGGLVFTTALGDLVQSATTTWSTNRDGARHMLPCRTVLLGDHRFGFEVDGWNGTDPLTVDPGLVWTNYLGGSSLDTARGLDVDANGQVTVTGRTYSSDFMPIPGGYQTTRDLLSDAYVTRFATDGMLVFSTYLGGNGDDMGYSVAVAANDETVVAGTTGSTDFPVMNAFQALNGGGQDGWIARLNFDGSALVFASYVGGWQMEFVQGFHHDSTSGYTTIGGGTNSVNFPVTSNARQKKYAGAGPLNQGDAFVVQVNGVGARRYASYLGGRLDDFASGVHGTASTITLAMSTFSNTGLTRTQNAFQSAYGGGGDVYVAKLVPGTSSTTQTYGTYFGGAGYEWPFGCHVNAAGIITIAGGGRSIPTTVGAFDRIAGGTDGYVSRLNPSLSGAGQLIYSTLIGGSGYDNCLGMQVDSSGFAVLTGWTDSSGTHPLGFPCTFNALQSSFGSGNGTYPSDAFVARIEMDLSVPALDQLDYGSYIGAVGLPRNEVGWGVHFGNGSLTVSGTTEGDLPTTTTTAYGGAGDGFVMRIDP